MLYIGLGLRGVLELRVIVRLCLSFRPKPKLQTLKVRSGLRAFE